GSIDQGGRPPVEARMLLMIGLSGSWQPGFGTSVSCGQTSIRTPPSGGGSSPTRRAMAKPADPGAAAPWAWYRAAVDPPDREALAAAACGDAGEPGGADETDVPPLPVTGVPTPRPAEVLVGVEVAPTFAEVAIGVDEALAVTEVP